MRDRGPPLVIRSHIQDAKEYEKDSELPAGDPRHYVYVDNLGVLSTSKAVRLCTPEAFARFEFNYGSDDLDEAFPGIVGDEAALFVGLSDIKDAFHRLRQPRWMQELFCLDPIPARWVGLQGQTIDGITLAADQLIYPMPASRPMGCSWSMFFAQAVSEHLMGEISHLAQSALLRDREPPLVIRSHIQDAKEYEKDSELPAGDPRHYVYVDNLGVLSTSKAVVTEALGEIKNTFEARGLSLHPGEVECDDIDALGCRLSGTKRRACLKPARFWRLRQGIRYLLGLRSVSGRVVEVILGHCTYCALLNRSLLSVFSSIYKFVRKTYDARAPLWASVREELQTFLGLLPLCYADWSREWNTMVSASDASLSGFGVCARKLSRELVGAIGRVPERERFRRGPTLGARAAALIEGEICDEDEIDCARLVQAGWEIDSNFPEVPRHVLRKDCWDVKLHGRWRHSDGILTLESHALLKSLSRIAHTRWGQHVRQLLLVDNMAVALAFDRGRPRNYTILRIIRKFGALCHVCDGFPQSTIRPMSRPVSTRVRLLAPPATPKTATGKKRSRTLEAPTHLSDNRRGVQEAEDTTARRVDQSSCLSRSAGCSSPRERPSTGGTSGARHCRSGDFLKRDRGGGGCSPGTRPDQRVGQTSAETAPTVLGRGLHQRPTGHHLLGVRGGHLQSAEVLPQRVGGVRPVRVAAWIGQRKHGCDSHRLPERPVLGRTATTPGRKVPSRAHARAARFRQARLLQAAQKLASTEGMEAAVSGPVSKANAPQCLAVEMKKAGQTRMALFLLLSVSTYSRPSELFRCTTRCLVRPSRGALNEWALLLAAQEYETPTKTGDFDHSVALDSAWLRPWVQPFLEALKQQSPTAPLWDFRYGEYLDMFRQAARSLGLDLSPYQTRHSGPSIDRARDWRSLYDVQKRGAWRAYKSVVRYEKHGRLSLSYHNLPRHIQVYADLCEQCVGDVLFNRRPPPAGP